MYRIAPLMKLRTALMPFLLALPLVVSHAQDNKVEKVRVWAAPDNTRVVFDIARPAQYAKLRLDAPPRVVLDIADTPFYAPNLKIARNDRYLKGMRTAVGADGKLRIVLDLQRNDVDLRIFQLEPNRHYGHRLVVDLLEPKRTVSKDLGTAGQHGSRSSRDVIIAIDAGHGGEDPGAIGAGNTHEKKVVLVLAKQLVAEINQQRGMRAILTREGDYFMALRKRIEVARRNEADLFISLHADAFHDHRVRGSSVYVLSQKGASSEMARWLADRENDTELIGGVVRERKDDMLWSVLLDLSQTKSLEKSIEVAEHILEGLKGIGDVHRDRVQSAGFAVLKSPDIPSILIETAFISNPLEEKKLLDRRYQKKLVDGIVKSLHSYFFDFAPEGTLLAEQRRLQYVIRSGDTLSEIAKRYKVSVKSLRWHNRLKSDLVRTGQTLIIPRFDVDS
ncbi:MAG: N-acetylmuramoyl-L-alanine amidase [Candidatus Eutrophobiaceae bacterium]